MEKLLAALKRNRQGHRDGLVGLILYRHGLRVSEACDLRWADDVPNAPSSSGGSQPSCLTTRCIALARQN